MHTYRSGNAVPPHLVARGDLFFPVDKLVDKIWQKRLISSSQTRSADRQIKFRGSDMFRLVKE